MYKKIMVPVDLAHADKLEKALQTAGDLAKHYGIPACYVGVTPGTPTAMAHNPREFAQKLEAFVRREAEKHGIDAEAKPIVSHDPAIDLDDTLMKAVRETDSDIVVMQSHVPNISDYIWPSNGGTLASHSDVSVFVVR